MPKLTVYRGRRLLFEHPWSEEDLIVLGRGEEVDVPLPTDKASREHCLIQRAKDRFIAEAMEARNGLFINGKTRRVKSLEDGDRIEIADLLIVFSYGEDERRRLAAMESGTPGASLRITTGEVHDALAESAEDKEAAIRQEMAASGWIDAPTANVGPERIAEIHEEMRSKRKAHLEVLVGAVHQRHVLGDRRVVLGFGDDADVRLPGRGLLGKQAAEIVPDAEGHRLVRRGKWVSIKVGGSKIGDEVLLQDGDLLDVGGAKMRYLAFAIRKS